MSHDSNASIEQSIGELKGVVSSLVTIVQESTEAINRRIDDHARSMDKQTDAINRRIDDHEKANHQRFSKIESDVKAQQMELNKRANDVKKAVGGGSAGGAIVATSIEIIKHFTG